MVKFCRENPVLATGNVDGDIGIYRLIGYEDCYDNNKNQRESLEKILYPQGYQKAQTSNYDEM